ncbi:WXG100 family type VII secretion target [Actinokineospora sp. 24-640]
MIGEVEQLVQRYRASAEAAAAARAEAERDRRSRRRENDRWVTGGVHWDGYSLKTLQRMVGNNANANQLDMLADQWAQQGRRISDGAQELSRSMQRLLQFWTGAASEGAQRAVVRNAAWLSETAETASTMAGPVEQAGGALRSAQSTMPGGSPSSPWLGTMGGGAAAGMAIGGPVGAVFGAAIGGIASAFGFGSNKKKMKRKAVQTMQRYENALLGIDGQTPQFSAPADGVDPGANPVQTRPPSTGVPGPGVTLPGGTAPDLVGGPRVPPPMPTPGMGTTPSFVPGFDAGWDRRWQGLTGFGPGAGGGAGAGGAHGLGMGNGLGFGGMPGAGGLGAGRGGAGAGRAGMGAGAGRGVGVGAGAGAGGNRGGGAYGRGGALGERTRGAAGRFGRGTGFGDPHGRGTGGYGAGAGGARKEEDSEHRRRVPLEEDPFTAHDLRAAPPVIGL